MFALLRSLIAWGTTRVRITFLVHVRCHFALLLGFAVKVISLPLSFRPVVEILLSKSFIISINRSLAGCAGKGAEAADLALPLLHLWRDVMDENEREHRVILRVLECSWEMESILPDNRELLNTRQPWQTSFLSSRWSIANVRHSSAQNATSEMGRLADSSILL